MSFLLNFLKKNRTQKKGSGNSSATESPGTTEMDSSGKSKKAKGEDLDTVIYNGRVIRDLYDFVSPETCKEMKGCWALLHKGFSTIFELNKMSKSIYMDLYSQIYIFCTIRTPFEVCYSSEKNKENLPKPTAAENEDFNSPAYQASWLGLTIYTHIKDFANEHLNAIYNGLEEKRGEDLVAAYAGHWKSYRFSASVVHGICMYLNRHWVKRENEDGRLKDIYTIYGMFVSQWRELIFQRLKHQLLAAWFELLTNERDGGCINGQLLRTVTDNIVELNVKSDNEERMIFRDHKTEENNVMTLYKTTLEDYFLQESAKYYLHESNTFITANSVHDYVKKILVRFEEEVGRSTKYLHEATAALLTVSLSDILIEQKMEVLHLEFAKYLEEEKTEELGALYTALLRIPARLSELDGMLENHLKSHGKTTLSANVDAMLADPNVFVSTMLGLHDRSGRLLDGLQNAEVFVGRRDDAFKFFMNNNAVVDKTKNTSKVAELLARYCDAILKSRNLDESEMEESLSRLMLIFRYVDAKDIFEGFYSKMLARRLIMAQSVSDDAEATMISKLKAMCGFDYTTKLLRMYQDVTLSKDLNEQLLANVEGTKDGEEIQRCDFVVQVCSSGAWPFIEKYHFTAPVELERPMIAFHDFYLKKYSTRKILWQFSLSRCDLVTRCFSVHHILQVSAHQAGILMCYNSHDVCTIEQLCSMVGFQKQKPLMNQILLLLLKFKVLALVGNDASEIEEQHLTEATRVKLNLKFRNKTKRINLNLPLKAEVKQDAERTTRIIEDERKILIQTALVRIMKTRKELQLQELIGQTMKTVSDRFSATVPVIKSCIDILIQKEYIAGPKEGEEEQQMYTYMA